MRKLTGVISRKELKSSLLTFEDEQITTWLCFFILSGYYKKDSFRLQAALFIYLYLKNNEFALFSRDTMFYSSSSL